MIPCCGLAMPTIAGDFLEVLATLRMWDGQPVPTELQQRLRREHERWVLVDRQIKDLENERLRRIRRARNHREIRIHHLDRFATHFAERFGQLENVSPA